MANDNNLDVAVLGGGCFWCIEPVFAELRGVHEVIPGYCGGHVDQPTYEQVCEQNTGHIEVIKVVFDPGVISFTSLLQVFFTVHDPTTVDRQGGDVGPQYASAIFAQSPAQKQAAQEFIGVVQDVVGQPVATKLLDAERFWPAEAYHHNYYARNPHQGYCQVVISPKLTTFRKHFAELLDHRTD